MAKAKILLVEDNKTQAEIIKGFLEKNGYEAILAGDGMAAFRIARTQSIDVVLLDLVLPDIDGYEVCRWLKLTQETRNIPVIMLTAKNGTPDKVAGLEAGADDYIPKPFDERELNARIYASLRTKSHHDELVQKNKQLEHMLMRVESLATTDSLTNLFNRRRFETILTTEFRRAQRYQHPLSCMVLDIDNFKLVNDQYGHQAGDVVLRDIAQILQKSIRDVDTVARWGGEEFIVLGPNTSVENARLAAGRILKTVGHHEFPGFDRKKITVSIGIAGIPDPAIPTEEKLLHAADLAMYEAKRKGKNRIEIAVSQPSA